MDFPEHLLYSEEHEWYDPDSGWMGITDFAQDELGDIVFIELPDLDREVSAMDPFMVVESVKAVSDIYAPVDGTVAEVNDELVDHPEWVNESPYEKGRMARLEADEPGDHLMDAEAYQSLIE